MLDITALLTDTSHSALYKNPQKAIKTPPLPPSLGRNFKEPQDIQSSLRIMYSLVKSFDKDLEFRWDKKLDRVIAIVVDKNTDAIIKEVPSEQLQKVLLKVQEALGLLFDQKV